MNRSLPAPAADIALLVARLILGVVLFAHGWQKLMINGIAGTYRQFDQIGIPLAIVSASFVTVVEFVGGVLLILGVLTTAVVSLHLIVMIGASAFVHISHGIFAQDGGWELVGVIAAMELVLAAVGAGKYSLDHLITSRGGVEAPAPPVPAVGTDTTGSGTFASVHQRISNRATYFPIPADPPRTTPGTSTS